MGEILSRIDFQWFVDKIDYQFQEVLEYIDIVGRAFIAPWFSDLFDWVDLQIWNFRAIMSHDSDGVDEDEFCLDKEGYHKVGATWSSRNRCNKKICVAHDTIKELRCPIVPENHACEVVEGNLRDPYPQCCDQLDCPLNVAPRPIVRPAQPLWWIHESYIHAFSSSSEEEEELLPHPSTVSAKLSGLADQEGFQPVKKQKKKKMKGRYHW